jgi:predicted small lipoprotein YifL
MNTGRIAISILAVGIFAATASGCGRRAALETPSQAAKAAGDTTDKAEEKKPERHFILDPLIE